MKKGSDEMFDLAGRVAVVTGGGGVLGGTMAAGLARAGARVAVLGRTLATLDRCVAVIEAAGGEAMAVSTDVLEPEQLEKSRNQVTGRWGDLDILVNCAGGNNAGATLAPDGDVFGLSAAALRQVVDLNLMGTILPSQVFGPSLAEGAAGCVVNISSMAADRALSRVGGYSAAKSGVDSYTRWLAVELARRFGGRLRINAIAPGFFVADQNRRMLLNEDGSYTERGETIIDRTPMGRFGEPDELVGTLLWLCSDAARFVTGIVVPVDGGFSAWSGV